MKSSQVFLYLGGWGLSVRGGQLRSMVNDGGLYLYDAEGAVDTWTFKATSAQESLEGYLFASNSSEWGDGGTKIWGRSKDGSWAARLAIPSDFGAKGVAEEDSTHMWLLGFSNIGALSRSGMSLTLDSCITDSRMVNHLMEPTSFLWIVGENSGLNTGLIFPSLRLLMARLSTRS